MGRLIGLVLATCIISFASGCVNLYTRLSADEKVTQVYQSSRQAAGLSIIIAFPQLMIDAPGNYGFRLENIFSIPLGCLCLCDAVCEAVIDTVCLPFDWHISAKRKRDQKAWYEKQRREYEANRKKEE